MVWGVVVWGVVVWRVTVGRGGSWWVAVGRGGRTSKGPVRSGCRRPTAQDGAVVERLSHLQRRCQQEEVMISRD